MIQQISSLTEMGVFQEFSTIPVGPFNQQNLIYGYNGCGKTTLSLLFKALADRALTSSERFPSARFEVALSDGTAITQGNIADVNLRVMTFNRSFIDENIDWNNSVKNVLLVAKESIADQKLLSTVRAEIATLNDGLNAKRTQRSTLERQCDKALVSCARHIKDSFQVIGTSDKWYFNYNKAKLDQLIQEERESIANGTAILTDEGVAEATTAARPDMKQPIQCNFALPRVDAFLKAHERIMELVNTAVASTSIRRLADDAQLQSWVLAGMGLHESRQVAKCEFCRNDLSEARWEELRQHFSEDFRNFKATLVRAVDWLSGTVVPNDLSISADAVYQEWRDELEELRRELQVNSADVNEMVESWIAAIRAKEVNPFARDIQVRGIDRDAVVRLSATQERVRALVDRHNAKTADFTAQTTSAKRRLERHYASRDLTEVDYFRNKELCQELGSAIDIAATKLRERGAEAAAIESRIVSERLGASEFNAHLHNFLGRSDIALRYNERKKGYDIVRGGGETHDGNLSEGERTAIAFVLFVTKLGEGGAKVEDTIVVVDDPVSSFDATNLFQAFAFLKTHCEDAKQLFVLTHNFTYFKLVRDWLLSRNRNRGIAGKKPNANFYVLEARCAASRTATLVSAGRDLLDYQSEYHYLFGRLYRLREREHLSAEDAYLAANLTRKLLETFFGFKFPKGHGDFRSLLNYGQGKSIRTTPQSVERIYRFVNRYSHSRAVEVADESLENLLGETPAVIADVLAWVEEVDPVHYAEMKDVVEAG